MYMCTLYISRKSVDLYSCTCTCVSIFLAYTQCLTEVEKRFRDQTSTKENSPQNHPQSTPRPPPASYSREQTLTGNGVHTHHHLHQFVSAEPLPTQPTPSLGSLDAAPHTCTHLQGSHDKHLPSHNHHHHHTESIFTNQLCEGLYICNTAIH